MLCIINKIKINSEVQQTRPRELRKLSRNKLYMCKNDYILYYTK